MTLLPVVAREMSVMARRKSMYWSRGVTAIVALLVMLWLLIVSASQLSFAALGGSIFLVLSSLCFVFAVLVGMQATADCVSEEKREGTLGLLFLTDLKGAHVVGGKFAASSLQAVLALIGVIPMLSLALLLGGVTLRQFGLVALILGNTMFMSLALGVFVSSLSQNERKAMVGTFVGLFLVVLGPFVVAILSRSYLGFMEELLAVSPLYAFASLHASLNPFRFAGPPLYFWHSFVFTHCLAWFFLAASAWILPRCLNELPPKRFRRVREFANRFVYGRVDQRKRHRAELLDQNAFLWLSSRERVKPKYAWGIVGFFIALYLWIALQFHDMLFDLAVSVSVMFLVHLVFKVWAASEVCSRLIQDRRSGALELLLSTPLSVPEIARGQSMALRRIFFKPIVALLAMELVLIYGGSNGPRQLVPNEQRVIIYAMVIATFLVDLWALKWVGLWLSLTGRSIERVLLTTLGRVLALPWLAFALAGGLTAGSMFLGRRESNPSGVILLLGLVSVIVSLALGYSGRQKFLAQFRELATRRFESLPEPEPRKSKVAPQRAAKSRSLMPEFLRRRPVAGSLAGALVLLVLFLLARREFYSWRVESLIERARAEGSPMSLSAAARFYPAPSTQENAFAMLATAGPPTWRGGTMNRRIKGRLATREEIRKLELHHASLLAAANEPQLAALWKLPEYQAAHIDPMVTDVWGAQYTHSAYSAILEADLLALGRFSGPEWPGRAERSIRALLAHARLLRRQPIAFAQYCAGESLSRLASGISRVFEKDQLSDEVLQQFQRELESIEDATALLRTIKMQRALFLEPPPNLMAFMGMPAPAASPLFWIERIPEAIGSEDKRVVEALHEYNNAIALTTAPIEQRLSAASQFNRALAGRARNRTFPPGGGPPTPFGYIPDLIWNDASFTAQLQLLRSALAAERYELQYGSAPPNLTALVPRFLAAVPVDPYSGENLRSIRRGESFLIYSIGVDRVDNSAQENSKGHSEDIVFDFR